MATRYEMEAEWYSSQGGQDSGMAKRSLQMATNLQSSAKTADRQAREYQRQLPHGSAIDEPSGSRSAIAVLAGRGD